MKNVTLIGFRAILLKYLKNTQHGEKINVTSRGAPLATLTPPVTQHNTARAKLRNLAKSTVIHDVRSPIEDNRDTMKW